ncbi:hypothetical protein L198_05902 [Cryptococcus wingfieldii CBS 7118]|uniref:Pectate lyase n=1 Tax=Cryptococcus wingfieldii CBS 7118 TaxID=1295528 RepID=A0A1E3IS71_9TREE|nr:hypothetical protein L198_05902 [Cryptococcus wingfieldii CBS 7118]ODN91388.1 hypothetical protein L198_05902 [Cryptococcus wingfieldii CBS 7118]
MVALFALLPFVGMLAFASPLIQRADNSTTIGQRFHSQVNADEWCVTAGSGNAAKGARINMERDMMFSDTTLVAGYGGDEGEEEEERKKGFLKAPDAVVLKS